MIKVQNSIKEEEDDDSPKGSIKQSEKNDGGELKQSQTITSSHRKGKEAESPMPRIKLSEVSKKEHERFGVHSVELEKKPDKDVDDDLRESPDELNKTLD